VGFDPGSLTHSHACYHWTTEICVIIITGGNLFVDIDKGCCLAVISEMKEILLSELTIMEEIGTGKFAVSGGFSVLYFLEPMNTDDDDDDDDDDDETVGTRDSVAIVGLVNDKWVKVVWSVSDI